MNPTKRKELEEQIDQKINAFIKEWLPDHYAHLVDSDDNAGEFLRQDLKDLFDHYLQEEVERARIKAVTRIMSAKTEGLFDGPDLFIKRAPVEQACIDLIGYEAYRAIADSLPVATPPQQPVKEDVS